MLNAYSVKNDFCIYFESTLEKHFGFRIGRGQMSPPHFPTHSVFDLNAKIALTLSNTSNLQRSLPKCVFPPVDDWVVISVK